MQIIKTFTLRFFKLIMYTTNTIDVHLNKRKNLSFIINPISATGNMFFFFLNVKVRIYKSIFFLYYALINKCKLVTFFFLLNQIFIIFCFIISVSAKLYIWQDLSNSTVGMFILAALLGIILILLVFIYWEVSDRFRLYIAQRPVRRVVSSFRQVPYPVQDRTNFTDGTCKICLTEFKQTEYVRLLPCSHVYHHGCIYNWMITNMTCPECRHDYSHLSVWIIFNWCNNIFWIIGTIVII